MNIKRILILFLIVICLGKKNFAQEFSCGSYKLLTNTLIDDSDKLQLRKDIRKKHSINNSNNYRTTTNISIPVVVHILHNNPIENISDEQIMSQISVLNKDFTRTNSDTTDIWPQAASADITFELAVTDPLGNPTTGITRNNVETIEYIVDLTKSLEDPTNIKMKSTDLGGIDAWPSDQYLNIWVVNMQDNIKGFSTFPGSIESIFDGIVVNYTFFGTIGTGATYSQFNKGRTTTHEVGHWLDLYHIWGDGCETDDEVNDTPDQESYHFGCPSASYSCDSDNMISNFMDYTYDACQNLFTSGQVIRMRQTLLEGGYRSSFTSTDESKKISSFVWLDDNENGIQDENEYGLSEIEVILLDEESSIVATVITDENGTASFNNLESGNYYVIFNENIGFITTIADAGTDDNMDSDITNSMANKSSDLFIIDEVTTQINIDGGFYNVVLPLNITEFKINHNDRGRFLSWNLMNTYDLETLELQRSSENDFSTIYSSSIDNNAMLANDSYLDTETLTSENLYYRLKSTSYSDKIEFSDILNFKNQTASEILEVFPNPASDYINLNFRLPKDLDKTNLIIKAINIEGKVFDLNQSLNYNTNQINIESLPSGMYYISITSGTNKNVQKLLKL